MDRTYTAIAYLYKFSGLEDLPRTLVGMLSACMYVQDSCKLVSMPGEAGAQSWLSHINVDVVCPDPTVSSASVRALRTRPNWEVLSQNEALRGIETPKW